MKRRLQLLQLIVFGLLFAASGVLAQTPVANYPFTGNAEDVSANGNDASVHGAKLTQDRFGWANRAFRFDGTQSYLQSANSAALNTPYTSVSFWAKPNSLPAAGSEVFIMSFGGWQSRWKISLPSHGKPVFTTNTPNGIYDTPADDGNTLNIGEWKQVTCVHDAGKDVIYMNGVQVAQNVNVSGTLNATSMPLGIGYSPIDNAYFFDGSLDDIQIFDQALTAGQVAALYAAQNVPPVVAAGLVASYSFQDNALDATSFGNHAQLTDVKATTDRFGYGASAYAFNGTSSEIEAANSAQLNSNFTTVSFWIKPNSLPAAGTEAYVLSFGGWQQRWKISLPNHAKIVWSTKNNTTGNSDLDAGGGNELAVGAWTHVVMTHDGTDDKIFINGALANSKTSMGALLSTSSPLGIGFDPIDGQNWFDGALDEVQIYNYAMSNAQVTTLYTAQSTFPGSPVDLVAEYKFTGNADDATQFGNDAAVNGATLTTDRFGYAANAYHFNGAESLLAENSTQLNSAFATVSFWVKVDELPAPGTESYLLSDGGWQDRWKISVPDHGKVVWSTKSATTGNSDVDAGAGNELPVGVWKHVVMVHNGLKDKIFINGLLKNEKDAAGNLNNTAHPLGIGYNPIDNGNYFKGSLDDIQVYNRALSDIEIMALFTVQSAAPVINDELVANYTFDGNTNDVTPFHNNAEADGAQLSTDRFNKANHAYSFDGVNDKILAANSPQQISDYTTVSFWIKVNQIPASNEAYILSNGGWQQRWKISLPSHDKIVWSTKNSATGNSDMDAGGGNELPVGVWKHVAMTHDGVSDKIFIDGVLANSKAVGGTLLSTTSPLGMGYDPIDNGSYFNGSLDEVQIYNRALSDLEIAALYQAQSLAPAITDLEAPSAPLNLAAVVTFNNVDLSWLPSTDNVGVTGYNLYQDGVKIMTTSATSAYLPGLTQLTTYTFGVTAVDADGNESLASTLVVTTGVDQTPDTEAPSTPDNLVASTGAHSILLSWDPSTDNTIVSGYVVSLDGVVYDTVSSTSVFVGNLDAVTLYTLEVYAFDLAGNNSGVAELTVSTDVEIVTAEPGLVAYYPFDGNANDATPYLNHGVIGGNPVFETANHANGGTQNIRFDGVADSVLVPNAVQLISPYTTVTFWIRVDDITTAIPEAYVLDFGHWSHRWKISLPHHHKIVWTTNSDNVPPIHDMDSKDGNELVEGFWWYVTMVHDGVNDFIYLNGNEVNKLPAPGELNPTSLPFCMGSNPVDGGFYFTGGLDEVKIYNKALTGDEVKSLFVNGTTGTREQANVELLQKVKQVFPNPATDKVWVKHTFDNSQDLLVRVFDVQGRQVGDLRFAKNEVPAELFSVNVQPFAAGTYFLDFVVEGKDLGSMKFEKK